jgi:hypothetical protein
MELLPIGPTGSYIRPSLRDNSTLPSFPSISPPTSILLGNHSRSTLRNMRVCIPDIVSQKSYPQRIVRRLISTGLTCTASYQCFRLYAPWTIGEEVSPGT